MAGPTLITQVFVGCCSILAGARSTTAAVQRRFAVTAFLVATGVVMFIGLTLSFRRLPLVQAVCVLLGGIILGGWLRGKATRNMLIAGIVGLGLCAIIFTAGVSYSGSRVYRALAKPVVKWVAGQRL